MMMRMASRMAIGLCLAGLARTAAANEAKPNLIWIWADNLAYRDLGCYGNPKIKTPRIDRLAEQGVRLTQYSIAHVVCSPSRAALLTGRQPFRVGIVDVLRPDCPVGLPPDEITIAEALKPLGYATAAFGKWHVGDRHPYLPLQQGFEDYLGLLYSMDMRPTLLMRGNKVIDNLVGDKVQNVTERLTDAAIEFVQANRDRPFFMYFSHTLPHPPINLQPEHRSEGKGTYGDAIEHIDREVGRLLDAVDRLGLTGKTLVVFSSDNGPMLKAGDTGGLRGRIRDAFEGGLRVPFIARLPGKIPAGKAVDTPIIAYDVFPTLVRLAGGKLPSDRVYDGQDIWPILSGETDALRRDKPMVWVYFDKVTALRDGKWKLHVLRRNRRLKEPELYDLSVDPGESTSVADQHPDVVRRLVAYANEFEAQVPRTWNLQYVVKDPLKRDGGVRRE